jgi:F0F1-type ATP synthase assembly protein I
VTPVVETTSPVAIIITVLLGFLGLVFIICDVNLRKKRHAEAVGVVYSA